MAPEEKIALLRIYDMKYGIWYMSFLYISLTFLQQIYKMELNIFFNTSIIYLCIEHLEYVLLSIVFTVVVKSISKYL